MEGRTDVIVREHRFGKTTLRRLDGTTLESLWELPLGGDSGVAETALAAASKTVDATQWRILVSTWNASAPKHNPENIPLLLSPALYDTDPVQR